MDEEIEDFYLQPLSQTRMVLVKPTKLEELKNKVEVYEEILDFYGHLEEARRVLEARGEG